MDAATAFARIDAAYESCRGPALEDALRAVAADCAAENGEASPLYAAMCSELGGYYRGQARYAESESAFLRALDILRGDPGEDSPDYTTALNNLAGTCRCMGKYEEAERLFRLCLERYAVSPGRQHVLYASALNNYALLCLDRGELARAEALLAQSSEVLSALPACRDEYASALCNRSALLLRLDQAEEAVPLLEEAAALYERELGTDTPHYHAALNSLGLARLALHDVAGAAESFRRAVSAAEALYGPEHPETQSIRRTLAQVERRQEEHP